jgi:aminoglycoside phosphotransferase (APT) family kinase protein
MSAPDPTATIAAAIVERQLRRPVITVERFTTGLKNWVYAARLADGDEVVIRLNRPGQGEHFAAAIRWQRLLAPRGVPLPILLAHDADPPNGGYPYMIITRLPGRDLGAVYPELSADQKRGIAGRIATIQRSVGGLPPGPGFGFASGYDDPALYSTWTALRADLARTRARLAAASLVDPTLADRVAARLPIHETYLARVPPTPFLDDTTTKNVLIHNGELAGIVDVDCICFGDPLFAVALTRTALLSRNFATDYIDYWCANIDLRPASRAALDLYTALFCVGFLAEYGQRFNNEEARPADERQIARLVAFLRDLDTSI